MICRTVFRVATVLLIASTPAMAGKWGYRESRATALEKRGEREKVLAQMKADGFTPIPRIIGGGHADEGEYPWMVALVAADEPDNYQGLFCGGTLIHPYWVLTAGHCVTGSRPEDIEVLMGATNLSNSEGTRRLEVAEIVVAPKYNDITLDSDFALLRLKEPADPSFPVIAVADHASLVEPDVFSTVIGWGDSSNGDGEYPAELQEVQLPIVDLQLANDSEAYGGTLTGNMLAAGFADGGQDSCAGDSGGPLLVPSSSGSLDWVQGGVVSFGLGCAEPGIYGIYTRIGNFRDYITGHILPNYALWERDKGRIGESRDPDGNGFNNFEDFALPDHVLDQATVSGMRRFSYVRPVEAGEVHYILENAATASGPWTEVQPSFVSSQTLGDGLCRLTVQLPEARLSGVFRIRAGVARVLVNDRRPLRFGGGTTGLLDATDAPGGMAAGSWARVYQLEDLPTDRPVTLTLRSTDFDAGLQLLDGATGAVLQVSTDNSAQGRSGGDEAIRFTAQPGNSYLARVVGDGGGFELNLWDPALPGVAPDFVLQPATGRKVKPTTLIGELVTSDDVDPLFQPGPPFYKDDFHLSVPPGQVVELKMASKGKAPTAIDDFLGLIDAESGRLLLGNDSFAGRSNDAGLRFLPIPGKTYLLRASSSEASDVGSYTLSGTFPVLTPKSPLATLGLDVRVTGKLSAGSELDERYFTAKRDYLLEQVQAEQRVAVTLLSPRFDAYLMVLDASDLSVVGQRDGGSLTNGLHDAKVTFVAKPSHRYIVRATTYAEREAGGYTLITATAP